MAKEVKDMNMGVDIGNLKISIVLAVTRPVPIG